MSADVTVVIPTRDRWSLLRRALRSALGQRDVDLQVVVVDEASSDETPAQLSRITDERLVVVRHDQPRGVAAARNAGLARAEGRYVGFLDDDDVWSPDKLRLQLAALASTPGAGWACSSAVWLFDGLRIGRAERALVSGDVANEVLRRNVVPGGASNVLAEAELVRSLGGFDSDFRTLADWDMWVRLGAVSPLAIVDQPLHGYFIHAGSMAHDLGGVERELHRLDRKYADDRAARDVAMDWVAIRQYLGAWALRQGDRRMGSRMHWLLVRTDPDRPARSAAAALIGGAWPGVQHWRDRRGARWLPEGWRQSVEEWLEPLRLMDESTPLQPLPQSSTPPFPSGSVRRIPDPPEVP